MSLLKCSTQRSIFFRISYSILVLGIVVLLAACSGEEPEVESEEETIKIGYALVGPVGDEGWNWTHWHAMQSVEKEFENVETTYVESVPFSSEATRTFRQFVDDEADMVFSTSEYADFLYEVSDANPDVAFLEANGFRQTDNLVSYYIEHWDPAFITGVAAGLMTESDQLGYVGSFPVPAVYASANAFHLGARSVNPNVETNVVLINSWFDPPAAREAAEALVADGSDFLYGIMDDAAYLEVAEEQGIYAAMWNADMREFGPEAYVTSTLLDWREFYISEVEAFINGEWEGNRNELLPIGEGTDRDEWGKNVPSEARQEADEVRDRMINEDYNPFVGPIRDAEGNVRIEEGEVMSSEDLYLWDWPVEGVNGLPMD